MVFPLWYFLFLSFSDYQVWNTLSFLNWPHQQNNHIPTQTAGSKATVSVEKMLVAVDLSSHYSIVVKSRHAWCLGPAVPAGLGDTAWTRPGVGALSCFGLGESSLGWKWTLGRVCSYTVFLLLIIISQYFRLPFSCMFSNEKTLTS